MKTKILIGSGAAVVAVGATVGIILGVMNNKPEEKPVISDTTSISEVVKWAFLCKNHIKKAPDFSRALVHFIQY